MWETGQEERLEVENLYKHKFEIELGPEISNWYKGRMEWTKRRKDPHLSTK